jgi:hypothetical protein
MDIKGQVVPDMKLVGGLRITLFINRSSTAKKNFNLKLHHRPNGFNRRLQNIPPNCCGSHILLSSSQKVFQNGSQHTTILNKYKKIKIISGMPSDHNGMKLVIIARETIETTQTHKD